MVLCLISIGFAVRFAPLTRMVVGFLAIMGVVMYWYQLGAKWLYRPIKGIGNDIPHYEIPMRC